MCVFIFGGAAIYRICFLSSAACQLTRFTGVRYYRVYRQAYMYRKGVTAFKVVGGVKLSIRKNSRVKWPEAALRAGVPRLSGIRRRCGAKVLSTRLPPSINALRTIANFIAHQGYLRNNSTITPDNSVSERLISVVELYYTHSIPSAQFAAAQQSNSLLRHLYRFKRATFRPSQPRHDC